MASVAPETGATALMRFFRLDLAYEGTHFRGWQEQAPEQETRLSSVAATLRDAISRATQQKKFTLMASGRTDVGVHARAQVAHCHVNTRLPPEALQRAINSYLPSTMRVFRLTEVDEAFHALRSARGKHYRYFVLNRRQQNASTWPFLAAWTWFVPSVLDLNAIRQALPSLVGHHDFAAFRNLGTPVRSTRREIFSAALVEHDFGKIASDEIGNFPWYPTTGSGLALVEFRFHGKGFLKQMVRNLVGHAVEIGKGKQSPSSFAELLKSGQRQNAGATAPPQGLFLDEVDY